MEKINVTRSSMPTFEEYTAEIKELWESGWITNRGVKHRALEKELERYLKTEHVSLFANGHVALEVAIDAFELQGEVITSPYTFCSTTHAIVRNGLTPVFCDITEDNYTIDPALIEEKITENTCAIVATHVYGFPCQTASIDAIARKYNLKVIYDAAHAFGVEVDGVGIADFGDAAMLSCHATKVFHTIEGGIAAFRNADIFSKIDQLTNFGYTGRETVQYVSTNAKMNEFEAAMGLCNLRHIDAEIEKRKAVFERYAARLKAVKGIKVPMPPKKVKHNYAYMPVLFDGYKENRNEIQEKLSKENIFARKYFYPITSELECYRGLFAVQPTPIAKRVAEQVLALPMYADLAIADVDRVCDVILR